jgi:prepilin-type N-terminal cleavage/methylation domain-containing protein
MVIKIVRSQSGFSLLEILVGLSILVLLLIALTNLPTAINLVTNSSQSSLARDIVVKQIEDLRSKTYDNLANTDPNNLPTISDPRLSQLSSVSATYQVIDCPNTLCTSTPAEAIKQVTVKISWKATGKTNQVQITTLIGRGGLQ